MFNVDSILLLGYLWLLMVIRKIVPLFRVTQFFKEVFD